MFLLCLVILLFALFALLVYAGLFNDPDGKESNQEYWQALKEMREKEKK